MADRSKIARSIDSLYIGRSTIFKSFLIGGVVVISVVFVWYTFDVIEQLQRDTRSQVEKYVRLWQMAANSPVSGQELQFVFDEIIVKATFPIIVLDSDREPVHWRNIHGVDPADTSAATRARLKEIARDMVADHGDYPLRFGENYVNYFCYGDSRVISQLKMMPFIEIGIVVAFLIVGLIGFQNIRRSEERHIWVGMAKETAHQLGTPITSLMGWLEVMDADIGDGSAEIDPTAIRDSADNMRKDVARLQRIANRFGKIGSRPELAPHDVNTVIQETVEYYRRRLPFEGKGKQILFEPDAHPRVRLNADLLGWGLENLVRNALQAVDPKTGRVAIRTRVFPSRGELMIEVADNGKGITPAAARKIFRAGFTTKARGWGLGLTLVKRIVEEYHGGKVHLKKSHPGETVFEMLLPLEVGLEEERKA